MADAMAYVVKLVTVIKGPLLVNQQLHIIKTTHVFINVLVFKKVTKRSTASMQRIAAIVRLRSLRNSSQSVS